MGGIKLQEQEKTTYPYGKITLIFNVLVLILSVALMLFIIFVWGFWYHIIILPYHIIILAYVVSTLVSFLCFYSIKLVLLKGLSSDSTEHVAIQEPKGSGKRQAILLFVAILLMLATPLIILFLYPDLWLVILNGIISGASISELVLYFGKRRR